MSDNKKYYYLKLKDNFFDSDEMIVLESMPDGYLYSNILLKLYLRSLKYDGRLMFNERIPFNAQMLSTITRHPVGVVEKALILFSQLKLIEVLDNGAIYMLNIQNLIGKSSTEADRVREYRTKIENERTNVQLSYDKSTPEIEIEKKREKEKEKEREKEYIVEQNFIFPDYLSQKSIEIIKKGNPKNYSLRIPIAYLNQVTNKNYKFVEKSTNLVKARINDGFVLDDFIKVIDIKTKEWLNSDMGKYLRPETLFGTKFDGYLNQEPTKKSVSQIDSRYKELDKNLPF